MGLFRRSGPTNEPPTDPELAELGRDYAIARRHRDRKQMNRINRHIRREYGEGADMTSFQQGQESYDSIPPISQPKRATRKRRR
jgi:hypothetical protein